MFASPLHIAASLRGKLAHKHHEAEAILLLVPELVHLQLA